MADGSGLIGRRIGSYQVLSLLGAGGMGEVYRAHDSRLQRDVALKVLRPSLSADPDLLARLDREARVLATLSHPHIAAIYQIEDIPEQAGAGAGARALVLELVLGDTLADRIARTHAATRRGLPVAETIHIASQIVSALDSAHERGVVHRDLKPANVKITDDQVVKVLDFGLAKSVQPGDDERSPTITSASREGMLLGTPAYMSPEQVRGKPVDKRVDIWAFGCVLYELLTGRPAFARATIADTISAILSEEPDWNALPSGTPAAINHLLRSCLTKDPKRRLRDIGDAHLDVAEDGSAEAKRMARDTAGADVVFRRLTDVPGLNESPAISPDGKMVAFVAVAGSRRQLFTVLLSGGTPLQVTRDDCHHDHPRWTPDSGSIVYFSPPEGADEEGTLWEIPVLGGTPRPVGTALGGCDINRSGRIAFFRLRKNRQELLTSARDGSDPVVTTAIPWGHQPCKSPRWSPDGRWIAFQSSQLTQFRENLCVVSVEGGEPRAVVSGPSMSGLSWMPDGSALVYSSSAGSTMPYPRTCNLRVIGIDGAGDRQITYGDVSHVAPDVHQSGMLLACRMRSASDIWKFPTSGSPLENVRDSVRITNQTGQVQTPSLRPDGAELVFLSDNGGHANLWISKADGSNPRQLTFERDLGVTVGVPIWSPTGERIAFVTSQERIGISVINANGRGMRRVVSGFGACWASDGQWLYYVVAKSEASWAIEKIHVDTGEVVVVRDDGYVHSPVVHDSVLYFATRPEHFVSVDWTICRASPDNGPAVPIGHIRGARVPVSSAFVHCNLSPDGTCLALPLIDGATTNIWGLPTTGGPMRPLTDFGDRATLIARQVSWSPDGRSIYAAVAEITGDVVTYDGLLRR